MRALGRLLRLSLLPSAAADVAAGLIVGGHGQWMADGRPWRLIGASLCIYHGAMALNDWADRAADASDNPTRPIPSGAVPASVALALALLMHLGAVLLAWGVTPLAGAWATALALLASLYDLIGRGPLLGPTLLALCRAGNLGLGLCAPAWIVGVAPATLPTLVLMPCYGAYVFLVSRLGRMEDGEDTAPLGQRPRFYLLLAGLALLAPALFPLGFPIHGCNVAAALLLAAAGAYGLLRTALQTQQWERALVRESMGLALRRLLIPTATMSLLAGGWTSAGYYVAAAILAGYPLSFALRKAFPPS